jgi:GNAT superfamily N-acetyltransferase
LIAKDAVIIRRAVRKDAHAFIGLLLELAKFEHLAPPTPSGEKRLLRDTFDAKRLNLLLAFSGKNAVAYALYFFTYSSFLAKPTLYLEDLFVSEKCRGMGIGMKLFQALVKEAAKQKCGRMEWAVLTWNANAIKFYEKVGARRLDEWHHYRLEGAALARLSKR